MKYIFGIPPDKKVLTITGDGGFMMNCQEIETAVRIGTPFVTLIFNDSNGAILMVILIRVVSIFL